MAKMIEHLTTRFHCRKDKRNKDKGENSMQDNKRNNVHEHSR
uniref:Uncharacterized protein n=1 Tax=Manihot esculenta TaxID=3983 RepID=A0A2C9UX21_MANES